MANLVYKRLFKLALAAMLAGCASEPVNYQVEYPKNTRQQSKVPPIRLSDKSHIQHYPDSDGRTPHFNSNGRPDINRNIR